MTDEARKGCKAGERTEVRREKVRHAMTIHSKYICIEILLESREREREEERERGRVLKHKTKLPLSFQVLGETKHRSQDLLVLLSFSVSFCLSPSSVPKTSRFQQLVLPVCESNLV